MLTLVKWEATDWRPLLCTKPTTKIDISTYNLLWLLSNHCSKWYVPQYVETIERRQHGPCVDVYVAAEWSLYMITTLIWMNWKASHENVSTCFAHLCVRVRVLVNRIVVVAMIDNKFMKIVRTYARIKNYMLIIVTKSSFALHKLI